MFLGLLIRNAREGLSIATEENVFKITPLDKFIIPLPLSLMQFSTEGFIGNFTFSGDIIFYEDKNGKLNTLQYIFPDQVLNFEVKFEHFFGQFARNLHVSQKKEDEFLLTYFYNEINEESELKSVQLELKLSNNAFTLVNQTELQIDSYRQIQKTFTCNNELYLIVDEKIIEKFNSESKEFEFLTELEIEEHEKINQIKMIQNQNHDDVFLTLTDKENLYINSKKIASDCSSFYLYKDYLLYTISSQTIYDILSVQTISKLLNKSNYQQNVLISQNSDWSLRNIEKNSKILIVVDSKVVFTLPRGNFETINHKILLLEEVKRLIIAKNYHQAFLTIRKHKLNFNLLIDLNVSQFIESVENESFFDKMTSEFIDLLILDLSDEVCPEIKYVSNESQFLQIKSDIEKIALNASKNANSKLNYICELFLDLMLKKQANYTYNILMIYSKMKPCHLQEGLRLIKKVKDSQANISQPKKAPHVVMSSQPQQKTLHYKDMLRYFCWLVSAEQLYRLALSEYDLDLAIMIAEFTNMDPKEYLPYIESLKGIVSPIDFKFKINVDLKMFDKAIEEAGKVI